MTREEIIRMAQEAQMPFYWRTGEITYLDKLERFAALVASAEREACAGIVVNEAFQYAYPVWYFEIVNDIKARGQA
jgi:hypothetical protein